MPFLNINFDIELFEGQDYPESLLKRDFLIHSFINNVITLELKPCYSTPDETLRNFNHLVVSNPTLNQFIQSSKSLVLDYGFSAEAKMHIAEINFDALKELQHLNPKIRITIYPT